MFVYFKNRMIYMKKTFFKSYGFGVAFIALIYILATLIGVFIYKSLKFEPFLNLLIADVAATLVVFIASTLVNNASVYDPYWSVQPIVITVILAITNGLTPTGVLMLVAISIWGIRLTANWAYTFSGLAHQDWRYTMLEEKTGALYPIVNFFGIHLVPTLIVYGCTLPAVYAIIEKWSFNFGVVLFLLLSLAAVLLQGIADVQMHKFRKNKTKKQTFIRVGLWKNSRHPNYLGEIVMWWGIALMGVCAMPSRWYFIAGAFANTLLFLFISIPMADKRQSKKKGFDKYKAETRMLFPIKKF